MAVWIGEPIGHTLVTWVEVAVRAIARGHEQVVLAAAEEVLVARVVAVVVVVQGQRSRVAGVAEAKGVLSSAGVVEAATIEEVGVVGVVIEAGVEVEARRMGVVLEEVVVVVVPRSVEVVGVATLRVMSVHSMQTQSLLAREAACRPLPSLGSLSLA